MIYRTDRLQNKVDLNTHCCICACVDTEERSHEDKDEKVAVLAKREAAKENKTAWA